MDLDAPETLMLSLEMGSGDYSLEIRKSGLWCTAYLLLANDPEEPIKIIAAGYEGYMLRSLDHIVCAADTAVGLHQLKLHQLKASAEEPS